MTTKNKPHAKTEREKKEAREIAEVMLITSFIERERLDYAEKPDEWTTETTKKVLTRIRKEHPSEFTIQCHSNMGRRIRSLWLEIPDYPIKKKQRNLTINLCSCGNNKHPFNVELVISEPIDPS